MSQKVSLRGGALGVVLSLAFAGVAAASSATPKLLSPNHKTVGPGAIRLVVNIPNAPTKHGVFLAIQPNKAKSHGHLSGTCSSSGGCDFVGPTHWKGSKYSYVAKFNFPGYWAVTPGTYYWQVHYFRKGFTGIFYSKIGSFTVS